MFRFAIITDTHIRAPGGDLSSPFPVNEKANGRAAYACDLIAATKPEFTIHLGDMVHPLAHMDSYPAAVGEAHRIFEPLKPELHFVPGNHDIGDKPSPGMPAKPTDEQSVAAYSSAFGAGRYSFEHDGVLFVVMNSSLVNSRTRHETEQREWLENVLLTSVCTRKFLFSHYPPFINSSNEIDHYDNYAEPGRSWLLELCVRSKVEAVFSGHVHHFFFNRFQGVKLHCLPATSFTRQDYAELFSVAPAPEFGRDDVGKFSVCTIDVMSKGYKLNVLSTDGKSTDPDKKSPSISQGIEGDKLTLELVPHLRHGWFESKHLPYNGPMEEFERKLVRNDYPLLRLLQLGVSSVRIPLSDLERPEAAKRLSDWASLGIRFVVFTVGIPDKSKLEAVNLYRDRIDALELLSCNEDLSDLLPDLQEVMTDTPVFVQLSKITTSAEEHKPGEVFAHAVSSGFRLSRSAPLLAALEDLSAQIDQKPPAVVFQLPWGQSPQPAITELLEKFQHVDNPVIVNVRLSDSNPAVANFNESSIAEVLSAALQLAQSHANLSLQCDTFEDIDRGYAPRFGLIDRLGNIRQAIVDQLR